MPLSLDCINVKGAMNPCRCGYYPDRKRCRCTLSELRQYMQKFSRPLLDRIDISVEVKPLSFFEAADTKGDSLADASKLEDDEQVVYSCLDFYPKGFESLSKETGLPMLLLISAVMRLCDKGLVMETFKNEYVKI